MSQATLALAAALLVAGTAGAEPIDAVPPALRACASVKKNSERLACYDQAMERLSSDAAAASTQAQSAAQMFGASAAPNRTAVERAEVASVSARVTALHNDASGALLIDLDNGQQWRQMSGSSSPLLEVGHEVTITRAALNSFRLSTPTGRALKVKRVQ